MIWSIIFIAGKAILSKPPQIEIMHKCEFRKERNLCHFDINYNDPQRETV